MENFGVDFRLGGGYNCKHKGYALIACLVKTKTKGLKC